MCRLAALPPQTSVKTALAVLKPFASYNKDGVGCAYVLDGKLVTKRFATPLGPALKAGLLAHLPHPGWTIFHLRWATHGEVAERNTHPFVVGNGAWAFVHNGVWGPHAACRALLRGVKFEGETDSEVAGQVLARVGPRQFTTLLSIGAALALHRSGQLWAMKSTTGDLEALSMSHGTLLASTFRTTRSYQVHEGWFRFGKSGRLLDSSVKSEDVADETNAEDLDQPPWAAEPKKTPPWSESYGPSARSGSDAVIAAYRRRVEEELAREAAAERRREVRWTQIKQRSAELVKPGVTPPSKATLATQLAESQPRVSGGATQPRKSYMEADSGPLPW